MNVDVVLASAPVPAADAYTAVEGDAPAKRRRGRPKKVVEEAVEEKSTEEPVVGETASVPTINVRKFNTRSKKL